MLERRIKSRLAVVRGLVLLARIYAKTTQCNG